MSIRSSSSARLARWAFAALLAAGAVHAQVERAPDVWYVPTPGQVVERMLQLARVGPADLVLDLGSGDGRIPILAALRYGARGVGYEINPVWVRDARRYAEQLGVADRVEFRIVDLFAADLKGVTVVALYLSPEMLAKLRPRFERELPPGTRIVSHEYVIPGWKPERTETMQVDGRVHTIHSFTLPARGE